MFGGFMKKLLIVGASGLVGQTVLDVLYEENLMREFEIVLAASSESLGKQVMYGERVFRYVPLKEKLLARKFDYVIFSSGDDISKQWVEKFAESGAVVIDNSNAFRREEDVPLIVPEINIEEVKENNKIISNPNCSTIQLVVVLDRLLKLSKIKEVVVSSYQSVSGAGKEALLDLKNKTTKYFSVNINENIIPQIGGVLENGFCTEEDKIMFETNKILKTNIHVVATTVRVPVSYCHGESVYVRFENKIDLDDIKNILKCDYVEVCDELVYPENCLTSNNTYVYRLRKCGDNEVVFFNLANNLRRGAAYNAIAILRKLMGI